MILVVLRVLPRGFVDLSEDYILVLEANAAHNPVPENEFNSFILNSVFQPLVS